MPWTNQGGGGPWGSGGKGPGARGRNRRGRLRPISRKSCAVARTDCVACCRAAIWADAASLSSCLACWRFGVFRFFRVEPDELGVVLRFGKQVREVQPGLNYHLPYPIETVLTPKALRVNKIDIGMRVVDDHSARWHNGPRRTGGEPDAHRRREYRRRRLFGVVES